MKQSDLYLILANVYAAANCGPTYGVFVTFLFIVLWFLLRDRENAPAQPRREEAR